MTQFLANNEGKVFLLNGNLLSEEEFTLTIIPKYLDTYSGYGVTHFVVSDNNNNVLFTNSDRSMGNKIISFSSSVTSITITNLVEGNPTRTGLGCWGYTPTNCTVTPVNSTYNGYYDSLILTNLISNSSITIDWGYGKVN
jgi:hypothetical protein